VVPAIGSPWRRVLSQQLGRSVHQFAHGCAQSCHERSRSLLGRAARRDCLASYDFSRRPVDHRTKQFPCGRSNDCVEGAIPKTGLGGRSRTRSIEQPSFQHARRSGGGSGALRIVQLAIMRLLTVVEACSTILPYWRKMTSGGRHHEGALIRRATGAIDG
jgi:hypothetical protein